MKVDNILQAIGQTPCVKLQRVSKPLACQLYGKCEFLNPGGSTKDRAALQMILDAESKGRIKPGDTLIEPSSGNTGIGLAMAGAVKGYRIIITISAKVSDEKERILKAFGATVYRAPEVAWDHPESNIQLAARLQASIPNAHLLNQYENPSNTKAHYEKTAGEILKDFDDSLKMIVMGVGTGGTITGVANRLHAERPGVKIVGVDPNGSILGGGVMQDAFKVEGIGYDFFPEILDNSVINQYVKVDDKASFLMARRLVKEEGLLVGGSSGAAVCAALQAAKSLNANETCLVILPDTAHNYLSKFMDDAWMVAQGFASAALTA